MHAETHHDPVDEPQIGSAVLMTWAEDRRRKWRANSVEDCLRAFLQYGGDSGEDWIFRRVGEEDRPEFKLWELPEPVRKGDAITGAPGRLLGCYDAVSSFRRTIEIDPDLGKRYGVKEVYLLCEEMADNLTYLDQSGKIRPLNLLVDGEALEPDADQAYLREQVEEAIPYALEPIYPYSRRR